MMKMLDFFFTQTHSKTKRCERFSVIDKKFSYCRTGALYSHVFMSIKSELSVKLS